MATPPELATVRSRQVSATVRRIVEQIEQVWRTLTPGTIEDELAGAAGASIVTAVAQGQFTIADAAQAYIAASMVAQGGEATAQAALNAAAFAGIAPDGGSLQTLLFLPAIGVRTRLAAGYTPVESMLGGLVDMARYASTSIADAGRSADQTGMTADRQCVAYTRVVNLPACSRCIILSGQQYSTSEGFLRHPNCDCQVVPLRDAEWRGVPTPEALFQQLTPEQQNKAFTVAGAKAIREGADIGQVVNARRGMSVAHVHGRDLQVTSEGTTRRGVYGRQLRRAGGNFARFPGERYARSTTPRLMPEEIFRIADDRDEQLRLLRRYGYLT